MKAQSIKTLKSHQTNNHNESTQDHPTKKSRPNNKEHMIHRFAALSEFKVTEWQARDKIFKELYHKFALAKHLHNLAMAKNDIDEAFKQQCVKEETALDLEDFLVTTERTSQKVQLSFTNN